MTIHFTVPGEPKGKGRPKFNHYTRTAYTPKDTEEYEQRVRAAYFAATPGNPGFEKSALCVEIVAFFGMPRNIRRDLATAMLAGDVKPTKKPDSDNILKIICDALNKFAYMDDAQVVHATVKKRWAEIPRVEVTLYDAGEVKGHE